MYWLASARLRLVKGALVATLSLGWHHRIICSTNFHLTPHSVDQTQFTALLVFHVRLWIAPSHDYR